MHILLITHFFPPKHNAGTENYTLGLAKSLQSNGNEVLVLCAEDWDVGDSYWNKITEENYQGIPVMRIHLNWQMAENPNRVLYYSENAKEWLTQFLKREKFDIVHVISAYSLGVGIMEVIKDAHIPLVLTLMDFWFLCPTLQLVRSNGELCDGITTATQCQDCLMALRTGIPNKLAKLGISPKNQAKLWGPLSKVGLLTRQRGFRGTLLNMEERKQLLRDAVELPDLVLSHSRIVKDMFAHHTKRDLRILQNGHDLSWLINYKEKVPQELLRIGYVGQIIPIKGVRVLVDAYKKAKISNETKLEIWGGLEKDISYVDELKELIDGDPSILLRGRFLHEELSDVFCNIDVLVVPSLWYENAPLVIQEAFAAKIPVIATDLGGMSEMVSNEVNGLLFERGNPVDLSQKLQRLVAEPDLLERLKTGIPKVRTTQEEVNELEKIYFSLVQNALQRKGMVKRAY